MKNIKTSGCCDLFGTHIRLNLEGQHRVTTWCGTICSALYLILLAYFLAFRTFDLLLETPEVLVTQLKPKFFSNESFVQLEQISSF